MIKLWIAAVLIYLFGALSGLVLMALLQINRIDEPVGIVADTDEEV